MKKEMLLSSLIATSLVSPGLNGWAMTTGDRIMNQPTALLAAAIDARLGNAAVYTTMNIKELGAGISASVLLVQPGGHGLDLYRLSVEPGELEMIIQTTDQYENPYGLDGGPSVYGDDSGDDVYYYLKPAPCVNGKKTYVGFTCNSSRKCEKEAFSATIDGDVLWIEGGNSDPDSDSLPSFIKGIALKLKNS
jgi:hypothetical protein